MFFRSVLFVLLLLAAHAQAATRILFVGNSFTYAAGSAAMTFRPQLVRDLNGENASGVPALFKALTDQLGLDYEVSLETSPGKGLDWHWHERRALLDHAWDEVVLQGYSTLDADKPGDAAKLTRYADAIARLLRARNPEVELSLMATWSRADQTYRPGGHWHGQPIAAMARDVQRGYEQAAAVVKPRRVIPVGRAWIRAIESGVARANPDEPAARGLNLWADDAYHASAYGSYLEALTLVGALTGCDPRLGDEPVARELQIAPDDATALQRVAWMSLPPTRRCSK